MGMGMDKRRSDCNPMTVSYYIPNQGDSVGIRQYKVEWGRVGSEIEIDHTSL
jgi:hypothetical protein